MRYDILRERNALFDDAWTGTSRSTGQREQIGVICVWVVALVLGQPWFRSPNWLVNNERIRYEYGTHCVSTLYTKSDFVDLRDL